MQSSIINFRTLCTLGFLVNTAFLLFAYYLEYAEGLSPCPLCLLQRGVFYIITVFFGLAALHAPKSHGRYPYAVLLIFFGLLGMMLAGRQIWIQHLPPEAQPSCSASLARLLALHPLKEALMRALKGSPECGEFGYTLLTLSLPSWALLGFLGTIGVGIVIIISQKKRWI